MLLFIPGVFSLGFNPRTTPTSVLIVLGIWGGGTLGAIYLVPWMMLTDTIVRLIIYIYIYWGESF